MQIRKEDIKVLGRLVAITEEGIVADSSQVYDTASGKTVADVIASLSNESTSGTTIDEIEQTVIGLGNVVSSLQDNITNETKTGTIAYKVEQALSVASQANGAANSLHNDVEQAKSNASSALSAATSANNQVSTLTSQVNSMTGQVNSAKSDASTAKQTAQSASSTANNAQSAANSALSQASSAYSKAEQALSAANSITAASIYSQIEDDIKTLISEQTAGLAPEGYSEFKSSTETAIQSINNSIGSVPEGSTLQDQINDVGTAYQAADSVINNNLSTLAQRVTTIENKSKFSCDVVENGENTGDYTLNLPSSN